jgi:hypothetical protein
MLSSKSIFLSIVTLDYRGMGALVDSNLFFLQPSHQFILLLFQSIHISQIPLLRTEKAYTDLMLINVPFWD